MTRISSNADVESLRAEFEVRMETVVESPQRSIPASSAGRDERTDELSGLVSAPSWVPRDVRSDSLMRAAAGVDLWLRAHPEARSRAVDEMLRVVDEYALLEGLLQIRRLGVEP